jgi:hypothetical protein
MATKISLAGRTDVDSYFALSGVFEAERLTHTPLLVFSQEEDSVRVTLVDNSRKLLLMDDSTQVMGQWRGEYRSDFFQFTVGQYRQYVNEKDQPLKGAQNVVKTIGPQGGFRALRYEIVDRHGTVVHHNIGIKSEAERLEMLFHGYGIPVAVESLPSRGR